MSAHLLNLLNELRKRDKMLSLVSVFFFLQRVNKFNNTAARMFYFIYHMTLLLKSCILV